MKIKACWLTTAGMALWALLPSPTPGAAPPRANLISILLTADASLSFGQIVATTSPGAVTVTPAGLRSSSGGVTLGNGRGFSPASFTVAGDANAGYGVTLPSTATLSGGGSTMTVDTFASTPSSAGNLGAGGTQTLSVGATLHVGAVQLPASYSGTYAVTVAYN
jgi:hypothetical protein